MGRRDFEMRVQRGSASLAGVRGQRPRCLSVRGIIHKQMPLPGKGQKTALTNTPVMVYNVGSIFKSAAGRVVFRKAFQRAAGRCDAADRGYEVRLSAPGRKRYIRKYSPAVSHRYRTLSDKSEWDRAYCASGVFLRGLFLTPAHLTREE